MLRTQLTPRRRTTPDVETLDPPKILEACRPPLLSRLFRFAIMSLHSTIAEKSCQPGFCEPEVTIWKGLAYKLPLVLLLFALSACSNTSFQAITEQQTELEYQIVKTKMFTLSSAARRAKTSTLRIYLGGDGIPWKGNTPSTNPSGTDRLGFKLFLIDPKATHYLSRPCYDIEPPSAICQSHLWTKDRYSKTIIDAMEEALLKIAGKSNIELVGYSGGGTLAVLLAQRLTQVTHVLTVGANLDHATWTNFHNTPALSGSVNPATNQRKVIGQELHLYGRDDYEVPAAVNHRYFDNNPSAKIGVVDNFNHRCCWLAQWPDILNAWENNSGIHP